MLAQHHTHPPTQLHPQRTSQSFMTSSHCLPYTASVRLKSTSRIAAAQGQYSSNLGVLQPVVEQSVSPADDPYAMQRVSPDSFNGRGYYLDGTSIAASLVLLLVLLALTFERILGLDKYINQALQRWKEARQDKRRNDVMKAREALEERWQSDETEQQ